MMIGGRPLAGPRSTFGMLRSPVVLLQPSMPNEESQHP